MFELVEQAQFEERWNWMPGTPCPSGLRPGDGAFMIYFTAAWCGPCKALDLAAIDRIATLYDLPVWKCDYVVNDYTPGYCNVRSFPTFLIITPKKIVFELKSNDTVQVCNFLHTIHGKK
jgi:thiol-disulfide isomerase/thioredoxin